MRLAIIVGVGTYNILTDLPACINDSNAVEKIIRMTKKYNEIAIVNNTTNARDIMLKITEVVEKYNDKDVSELFFYFSGHGEYTNNEFYYLCSDFNPDRRNSTTLKNSELDELFKTLAPKLMIKVVDACQSGVSYIKEYAQLEKYLIKKQEGFKDLYFMFSSQADQSSYADNKMSFFTKSFINSILNCEDNIIRYRDITNYIADDFQGIDDQVPIFVNQASLLEKFGEIPKADRDDYIKLIKNDKEVPKELTLVERVKLKTSQYCTDEDLVSIYSSIESFLKNYTYNESLDELFDIEITTQKYDDLNGHEEIIQYIEKKNNIKYRAKVEDKSLASTINGSTFDTFYIKIKRKFESLRDYNITLFPVFSDKNVLLFHLTCPILIENDKWTSLGHTDWYYYDMPVKPLERLENKISEIIENYGKVILDYENKEHQDIDINEQEEYHKKIIEHDDDIPF